MLEVINNYYRVLRYCHRFPKPGKNIVWLPYKCYRVYRWRKEIGIIPPVKLVGIVSFIKYVITGINSYGHWLRN